MKMFPEETINYFPCIIFPLTFSVTESPSQSNPDMKNFVRQGEYYLRDLIKIILHNIPKPKLIFLSFA